jgi:spore maturation protein CgeB
MKLIYFSHSIISCWNHGNAHFQRGLLRELTRLGVDTLAAEPAESWSRTNLMAEQSPTATSELLQHFPDLNVGFYRDTNEALDLVQDADVVIVHEWTDPAIVAAVGDMRQRNARCLMLFHDTHHRAVSAPDEMARFDLSGYDAVIAFGEAVAEIYRRRGWSRRTFVMHEAADTELFRPPEGVPPRRQGLVWIGNWGDEERSAEIEHLLLRPARDTGFTLDVYGVRYPPEGLATLASYGARYHGWVSNVRVPTVLAGHLATVHVPRRHYSNTLPGIPTIRVFEALACGIPLVSGPWRDTEGLFVPGEDFLIARDGQEATAALRAIRDDAGLRDHLAARGLSRIRSRHTCAHRATELLDIVHGLGATQPAGVH